MFIPKIRFREMTLDENIDIIKWGYFENGDALNVHKIVISQFEELNNLDENLSKEDIYRIIEEVVTTRYNNEIDVIRDEITRYNEIWNKYNDLYFMELSKYLNISWPSTHEVIDASVGLIPIFPRYLDNFSFSIGINLEDFYVKAISAHETLHFLWFEKWKELYPNSNREEFDSPHIPWLYSEMVTDPILNSDIFKHILDIDEKSYDYFYDIKDGNNFMMDKLKEIYNLKISIEDKIVQGYEYANKILDSIGKINN